MGAFNLFAAKPGYDPGIPRATGPGWHPEGERVCARADVVCLPEGPAGAHKLSNRGAATARLLMLSTIHEPNVAAYPDSDTIGVWPGDARDELYVRRDSAVDYWDREA